jgi:hypothetical protein
MSHSIFIYIVPLKSPGIVKSANLFKRILTSLCVVRKYAKRVLSYLENTSKVFNYMWRMRERSLRVHRDYGNFRMVLYIQSRLRIRQKYLNMHEEHT